MRLGAHMSTSGGVYTAFKRGDESGCDSILIFTKSNRQWKAKPLSEEDVTMFTEAAEEYSHISPVAVHASYLINIGSSDEDLWEKSYQSLKVELERVEMLNIPYLTFHPGAFVDTDERTGLDNIARGLKRLLEETAGFSAVVCLETMAGTGTTLGYRFEHLAYLLREGHSGEGRSRLGVCFDTCHVFAAGYDIRSPNVYEETLGEFDEIIGLDRIKCFHFNDSKYDIGARRDRHAHIGQGFIGLDGFANFVNDPRWSDYPAHLETPKKEENEAGEEIEMDAANLKTLRDLIR